MTMGKHKNKIIIGILIIAILTGLWFASGTGNRGAEDTSSPTTSASTPPSSPTLDTSETDETEPKATIAPSENPTEPETSVSPTIPESTIDPTTTMPVTDALTTEPTEEPTTTTEPPTTTIAPTEPPAPTQDINPDTGKDRYNTDPVPSGQPLPVEPQDVVVGDGSFTVTLSVRCDTLLDNMSSLDKEKHELVPEDGVIFPATVVTVYEGESVFNVLQREMKRAKIHMEFVNTPIYNSAYIEGINNLYEFDGGELSGWMYKVNDWFPNYGCSRYQLKPGDVVAWIYTCDLGRDIGGGYAATGGR